MRSLRLARSQWWALTGVVVLLVGAFALRERPPEPVDLAPLRAQAELAKCPAGLGPGLPAVTLGCLGGGPDVELRARPPGRPTLVNIWATWCGPCVDEVPELVAFHRKAGDRVGVVGVLNVDTQVKGLAFSRDFGIRYPSLVDPDGEVYRAAGRGIPVTLFLDADGGVAYQQRGAFDDLAEIEALVAQHLGVRL